MLSALVARGWLRVPVPGWIEVPAVVRHALPAVDDVASWYDWLLEEVDDRIGRWEEFGGDRAWLVRVGESLAPLLDRLVTPMWSP